MINSLLFLKLVEICWYCDPRYQLHSQTIFNSIDISRILILNGRIYPNKPSCNILRFGVWCPVPTSTRDTSFPCCPQFK